MNPPLMMLHVILYKFYSTMHPSRMRTVRCSGRLFCHTCPPCHACSPFHARHPLPCMPHLPHMPPAMHAPYNACPPVNRMTDRQVWKHCLSATTAADGNNWSANSEMIKVVMYIFFCTQPILDFLKYWMTDWFSLKIGDGLFDFQNLVQLHRVRPLVECVIISSYLLGETVSLKKTVLSENFALGKRQREVQNKTSTEY